MTPTGDISEQGTLSYEQRLMQARYYKEQGDVKRSFRAFSDLLLERPDDYQALLLAGEAMAADYPGFAGQIFARALEENPGNADALNNIGHCIGEVKPDLAHKYFQAALNCDPGSVGVMINLASSACQLGEWEECVSWADKALEIDGKERQARGNGSLARLALGDWERGWQDYTCLLGHKERKEQFYTVNGQDVPRWDGWYTADAMSDWKGDPVQMPGRKVLVYGEQGIGDEIMFLSMLPAPMGDGGYIECQPRMESLFRRSFPDWTIKGTRLEAEKTWPAEVGVTHKLEMGGLGQFFAPEPIRRGKYLEACPVRKGMWAKELGLGPVVRKRNIGLAWTGGQWKNGRAWRSIAPTVLRSLIDAHPDVNFVSLEYLPHDDVPGVTAYPWATGKDKDIDDVAALIDSLDLVIAVTTSAVDISGALGKECWALVPKRATWRYGHEGMGDKMHFYESVKVYRQTTDMDWAPVVRQVSKDLEAWKCV